jgi:hypothetical protein
VESNVGEFDMSNMSTHMDDDKLVIFISTNVQQFIKEQVALTDQPLVVAGCIGAQLRHLYVALIGEEDTCKVFEEMIKYKPEKPTMH